MKHIINSPTFTMVCDKCGDVRWYSFGILETRCKCRKQVKDLRKILLEDKEDSV